MKISSKNKERALAPEGVHAARCVRVLDLGTQYNKKFDSTARKVQLAFELVDETHVFNEEKGEQPFVVYRTYTASLNKKASLYKDIQAWLGLKLEKNAEFDVAQLLNKPCQVQILHNSSESGETYANIQSIMAPPKTMKVKNAASELVMFSLDPDEFDQEVFDSFPDFLKEIIEASPEYKALEEPVPAKKPMPAKGKPAPAKGKKK